MRLPEPDFAGQLAAVAERIETTLDGLLSGLALPGETTRPSRLLDAMRYAALDGGKRLRPFLLIETARLFGGVDEGAFRAAAAIEMVHCYSLVHDDLPAMDDDDLRRGRPTVHKAFDEATAILAGDALLTYAFDVLAEEATHPNSQVRAALVVGLARAAGLGGMAGGQALDLAAERSVNPLRLADVNQVQAMKTGALLRFSVEAGGLIGGADGPMRAALLAYGQALGAAFQIADDILDAEGDEVMLGKRVGKDAGRNKPTLVAVLGIEAAKSERDRLSAEAESVILASPLADRAVILTEAARFAASRKS